MRFASSKPIIAVYGEAAYEAAEDPGSGLAAYEAMCLPPDADAERAFAFMDLPEHLTARPIVIWPAPGAQGLAAARRDAALLADGIASAVGIAAPPPDLGADFALGGANADDLTALDIALAADTALWEALARALPDQICCDGRAVAPWPHVLDAGAMFAAARAFLSRYLAEPRASLDTMVLWCLQAWLAHHGAAPALNVSPRLILQATDARADHARALRLLSWLAPSPRIVSRAIAMHLLPAIQSERPTLLLDDVAGGILYRREMRALIAAGATRDSTFLVGARGGAPTPWASCFAPAAIATATRLPEDMRLRAIVVPMSPVPAGATRERLTPGAPPAEVMALRSQMSAFAAGLSDAAGDADAALPKGLSASARENWHPLFAVAAAIGARAMQAALSAVQVLAAAEPAPASNLALLSDIRTLVPLTGNGVPSAQVIEHLAGDAERPWASIRRGGKIDARELAERLRTFGLRPATLRMAEDSFVRGYRTAELADAFNRYLGPDAATCGGAVTAV